MSSIFFAAAALGTDGSAIILYRVVDPNNPGAPRCPRLQLAATYSAKGGPWTELGSFSDPAFNPGDIHAVVENTGAGQVVWSQGAQCDTVPGTVVPSASRRYSPISGWEPLLSPDDSSGFAFDFNMSTDRFGITRLIWQQINPLLPNFPPLSLFSRWTTAVSIHTQLDPGECLDVAGARYFDGAPLLLWQCHGGNNQRFHYIPETQELKTFDDTFCVEVNGSASGSAMSLWTCGGGPNQKFTYSTDGEIKGISGLCLDAAQASSQNGTKVLVWTCHGGMNQKWQP